MLIPLERLRALLGWPASRLGTSAASGGWLQVSVPLVSCIVGALAYTTPAAAAARDFLVPPSRLGSAAIRFARQAGLSVGIADPALANHRSGGVTGHMDTAAALARLLAGTGTRAVFLDATTVRIEAVLPVAPARPAGPDKRALAEADIVVSASKQVLRLGAYPGAVEVVELHGPLSAGEAARGSEALIDRVAALSSTSLGPGRNKLFIRGAADSSFNGPSQSTVGQYLGDVRLTFNAPDPRLSLYDVERVEVLEGPQGTLYGTGSIGGIIRLVPAAPDTHGLALSAAAGVLAVRHGQVGGDAAAMVNVPLRPDRLALRLVGYSSVEPGYIDDLGDGRRDVNRTKTSGIRGGLRYTPGGWTIDAGGIAQDIASRDGQYAQRGLPPLTRSSHLPQPFDNDYRLAYVTAATVLGNTQLTTTTSFVRHQLETIYDATGFDGGTLPLRYREKVDIDLFSHETRASGTDAHGRSWIAGVALTHDVDRLDRVFDPAGPGLPALGVRNKTREAALFGQVALPLTARLTVTGGGRGTYSTEDGNALNGRIAENLEPSRASFAFTPLLALSWAPRGSWLVYVRYQEGARAGGLSILSTSPPLAARFETDKLTSIEAGVRQGRSGDPISFDVSVSRARWRDIQSDLIDTRGLPFTANIGNGHISALEARAVLQPHPALRIDASLFLNDAALDHPASGFETADESDLPNIPHAGARLGATLHLPINRRADFDLTAGIRYVGRSKLGIAPPADLAQGGYADTTLGASLSLGRTTISLDLTNLLDSRRNRFAFGNPFTLVAGDQITPLRPRSVRLGVASSF